MVQIKGHEIKAVEKSWCSPHNPEATYCAWIEYWTPNKCISVLRVEEVKRG